MTHTDAPPSQSPIESPCILVCTIEPSTGWCRGCGRTTHEIGAWSIYPPEQRAEIMRALPERMAELPPPPRERRVTKRQRLRDRRDG